MRKPLLVLAALLMIGAAALAQNAPIPKANVPNANDAKLDDYLTKWEQKMRDVKSLTAQLERIDKDKVLSTTTKFVGYAQYQRSGDGPSPLNMAVLELKLDKKTDVAEKMV